MKRSAAHYEEKASKAAEIPSEREKAKVYATLAVAANLDRIEAQLVGIYEQQDALLEREGISHGTARDSASAQFE